jgi:colanic acid/amylovoran biosynthesis glycosyltransferase
MSRFPKLTETFILYEMLLVEEMALNIEIYPLKKERPKVIHPESQTLVERTNYVPFISLGVISSNLRYLMRKPKAYLGALRTSLRATWGSRRYFIGVVAYFPKVVHIAALMAEADIQHVHVHFVGHPTAAAFIIHRLTGIPYSFTAHGGDLHRDQHMLCEKVDEAAFIVSISDYNRNLIADHCGDHSCAKVHVIHCGVNLERFRPGSKDPNKTFSIICVGSLQEVKGQIYLIEACRLLRDRGVDFELHLVGEGEDREKLEEIVRGYHLEQYILFCGSMPHAQLVKVLQQMDLMTLPSVLDKLGRREGIPVALMEGMAMGLPVVSSRLSGIPELVLDGETGYLVEPRDTEGIADAIEKLYRDPELRSRFGNAGRQRIIDEFELHKNVEKLIDLFEKMKDI